MVKNSSTETLEHQPTKSLLTPFEVATYIGVSENTLSVWRCVGRYEIPFVKIGRLVRYKRTDLEVWISSRTHASSTAA